MEANEMDANEAAGHLAIIRRIMESAAQYTVLPGRAAIVGGVLALAGCAVTFWLLGSTDFQQVAQLEATQRSALAGIWALIAIVAIGQDVLWTVVRARKRGINPWSRLAQMAAYAMAPGVIAGIVLTVALASHNKWQMLPGIWMMLYGSAIWMAGVLSARAPKALGFIFFVAGVLALFWLTSISLILVALTFGLAHIVFGIYLIVRFGD
jgi:hypothetical protein